VAGPRALARRGAEWHREQARDCFVRAAAALTEHRRDDDRAAFALVTAAEGLRHLAAADVDERARELATRYLESLRAPAPIDAT